MSGGRGELTSEAQLTSPVRLWDREKQNENSLSDSEDEGTGGRRHRQSHREGSNGSRSKRRRSQSPRTGSAAPSASVPAAEATPATTVPAPIAPAEEGGAPADNGSSSKGPVDIQSWAENVVKAEPAATPAEAAAAGDDDVEMADASAADVANGEVSGAGAGDVVAEGA